MLSAYRQSASVLDSQSRRIGRSQGEQLVAIKRIPTSIRLDKNANVLHVAWKAGIAGSRTSMMRPVLSLSLDLCISSVCWLVGLVLSCCPEILTMWKKGSLLATLILQ